jgi:cytochrome c-type biogenesis protein CcmH/NrfG
MRQRAKQSVVQGDALASTFHWRAAMDAYSTARRLDPDNKAASNGYAAAQAQWCRECPVNPDACR